MLLELKFVQGAVAKKELIPSLTHFRIEGGRVRSFNGMLALCSPIAFDIDCSPKAIPFVKAIQNCNDTVTLNMTTNGRLSVKSGPFNALIECVTEETPHVEPEGIEFQIDGEALLKALKVIAPFIGNDASRPWTNGVLLRGQSAFATNNVTLIEYWVGTPFPLTCNVPRDAIREMVRIGEPPTHAQADGRSITFHYSGGRWVRTNLLSAEWPDLAPILETTGQMAQFPESIFEGLEALRPFLDKLNRVYFNGHGLSTTAEDSDGAHYKIADWPHEGIYAWPMLMLLKDVAKWIDFSSYPKPCIFQGDRLRGAIIGMRL